MSSLESDKESLYVGSFAKLFALDQMENSRFLGKHLDFSSRHLYGGQLVSQAIIASQQIEEASKKGLGKQLQSLHCYFLAPGNKRLPVYYDVVTSREGRSFSSRHITALQDYSSSMSAASKDRREKVIFEMIALFQEYEPSAHLHQAVMPTDLPKPGELADEKTLWEQWLRSGEDDLLKLLGVESIPETLKEMFLRDRPIDVRFIDPVNPIKVAVEGKRSELIEESDMHRNFWFRFKNPSIAESGENSAIQVKAALAYVSDYGLMGASMKPHGLSFIDSNVKSTSLDHSIWFHRTCPLDGWFLYQIESTNLSQSRGLNFGRIFNEHGELIASTAQEGLIRLRS